MAWAGMLLTPTWLNYYACNWIHSPVAHWLQPTVTLKRRLQRRLWFHVFGHFYIQAFCDLIMRFEDWCLKAALHNVNNSMVNVCWNKSSQEVNHYWSSMLPHKNQCGMSVDKEMQFLLEIWPMFLYSKPLRSMIILYVGNR